MGWPEQAPGALHSARLKIAAEGAGRRLDRFDKCLTKSTPPHTQAAMSSAQTGETDTLVLGIKTKRSV